MHIDRTKPTLGGAAWQPLVTGTAASETKTGQGPSVPGSQGLGIPVPYLQSQSIRDSLAVLLRILHRLGAAGSLPGEIRGLGTAELTGARARGASGGQDTTAVSGPRAEQASGPEASNPLQSYALSVENQVNQRIVTLSPEEKKWQAEFNADPKNREYMIEHNQKTRAEITKVRAEMDKIQADPKMKPEEKASKLEKLQEKIAGLEASIGEWPMDMAAISGKINAILEDPNLSDKQKKNLIKSMEKSHRFVQPPKASPMGAPTVPFPRNFFKAKLVDRIRGIVKEGKKDLENVKKNLEKNLEERLESVVQRYGKDSPEATQARQAIDAIKGRIEESLRPSIDRLGQKNSVLKSIYPSFWSSFFSFFKSAFQILSPMLNLIPGVGTALYGAYQIGMTVYNAAKGNILGAITSGVGALTGVGSAIGGTVGSIAKSAGTLASKGIGVVSAAVKGDIAGALTAAGGFTKLAGVDVGKFLDQASTGVRVIGGMARGDWQKALTALGEGVAPYASQDPLAAKVLGYVADGKALVQGVASGDFEKALAVVSGHLDAKMVGIPAEVATRYSGLLKDGLATVQAVRTGSYEKALQLLSSQMGGIADTASAREIRAALESAASLAELPTGAADFVRSIATGRFEDVLQGFCGDLSAITGDPRFAAALQTVREGEQMFSHMVRSEFGRLAEGIHQLPGEVSDATAEAFRDLILPAERFVKGLSDGSIAEAVQALARDSHPLAGLLGASGMAGIVSDGGAFMSAIGEGAVSGALSDVAAAAAGIGHDAELFTEVSELRAAVVEALNSEVVEAEQLAREIHEEFKAYQMNAEWALQTQVRNALLHRPL